jgi:2-(1,2-epoxy-1,2-dihydrophenyl)acetyl-CoA isomerase
MSAVFVTTEAGVATITLNRPDVLNALNGDLMRALGEAMASAEADPSIRCILLTGAGKGFSSGADLASVQLPSTEEQARAIDLGAALREHYNPLIERMRTMPKPIVSAVNGVAAGAGMSIALAADIVLAARSASFLQAFAKIGLVPDAGSTWFLPRLVGDARARALMMLADQISAEDAWRYGMVWQLHDDEALMPAAQALAARLSRMPTQALGLIKQAALASADNDLRGQLHLEANLQHRAGHTHDFREGVTAFLQKRKPQFTGH